MKTETMTREAEWAASAADMFNKKLQVGEMGECPVEALSARKIAGTWYYTAWLNWHKEPLPVADVRRWIEEYGRRCTGINEALYRERFDPEADPQTVATWQVYFRNVDWAESELQYQN